MRCENAVQIDGRRVDLGRLRCEADLMRGRAVAEVVQRLVTRFGTRTARGERPAA